MRGTKFEALQLLVCTEDCEQNQDNDESDTRPFQPGPKIVPGLQLFSDVHRALDGRLLTFSASGGLGHDAPFHRGQVLTARFRARKTWIRRRKGAAQKQPWT